MERRSRAPDISIPDAEAGLHHTAGRRQGKRCRPWQNSTTHRPAETFHTTQTYRGRAFGGASPLNQDTLELAQWGVDSQVNARPRDKRADIGKKVPPRRVKDEPVDGFAKPAVYHERSNDKSRANHRED
jgi:hypothetical protein